jgi:hypothetical protein
MLQIVTKSWRVNEYWYTASAKDFTDEGSECDRKSKQLSLLLEAKTTWGTACETAPFLRELQSK